jgi:MFS superfamily sulfate permease-like transporter
MLPSLEVKRTEIAGALGDLGTFVPLLVGMVGLCGLQLGPTLVLSGLTNVATGLYFGIPMPVQPMKAIAAVAIDEGLNESQILTAGIATGAIILVLGATGFMGVLARRIPRSVVRGLQLALGLKLVVKGVDMISGTEALLGWDSMVTGICAVGLALILYNSKRYPGALVVFCLGLAVLVAERPSLFGDLRFGMDWRLPDLGSWSDWRVGLLRGAVPQVPLTALNSVIAVCALSVDLFPRRGSAPGRTALSVGLMNLIACPLGGMPSCHGAGGLAAQYRFGARSGNSMIMLGGAKILLGVMFGGTLFQALQAYPDSILGALLMFGGLELALVCRDQQRRTDFFAMILTAGVCMAINAAVGFLVGWLVAALVLAKLVRLEPPGEADTPQS